MEILQKFDIKESLYTQKDKIDEWLLNRFNAELPVFYCSVDIRDAGDRIIPVDTNIYPAGFNNLNLDQILQAKNYANSFISKNFSHVKKILIIKEDHDRNLFYEHNISVLQEVLSGFEVKSLNIKNASLEYKNYDLILLNNDLTSGCPDYLKQTRIPILPSYKFGWFQRSKYAHYQSYEKILESFTNEFSIPKSAMIAKTFLASNVDILEKKNLENIINAAEHALRKDLYIKADNGTYGMGVAYVKNVESIDSLNKDVRKKLSRIKEGVKPTNFIIQEAIKSVVNYDGAVAEPSIYMLAGEVIAIFQRFHAEKNEFESLSSPGAKIVNDTHNLSAKDIYAYNVVAKLACLACALELDGLENY